MFLSLLIVLILALIGGAFFLASDKSGEPSLLKGLEEIRSMSRQQEEEQPANTATVYKWKDDKGEWHFSNTPPPEGVASEVKTYRTDINVVAPTLTTSSKPAAKAEAPATETPALIPGLPDPSSVKKLMDDARAVQDLGANREKQLERQLRESE